MSTKRKTDDPSGALVWFAELWLARRSGDRQREARARRQLRVHGVDVLIDDRGRANGLGPAPIITTGVGGAR